MSAKLIVSGHLKNAMLDAQSAMRLEVAGRCGLHAMPKLRADTSVLDHCRSALRVLGWLGVSMAWLFAVMYSASEIARSGEVGLGSALALSYAVGSAFGLAHKWIKIAPGILAYGALHFTIRLATDSFPDASQRQEAIVVLAWGVVALIAIIYIRNRVLDLIDRAMLTLFSIGVFLPVGLGLSSFWWPLASLAPLTVTVSRHASYGRRGPQKARHRRAKVDQSVAEEPAD